MIVFNFDVVARPHEELSNRTPDPEGMRLWRMFHEQTMGRMALVVDEEVNKEVFEHWLLVNNVKAAMYQELDTKDPAIKADKVQLLMTSTGRVDWYVDNDPIAAAKTLRLGIPTLLVANPYIVRPEWSGIKAARSWDDLVHEVESQVIMKAEKNWGEMT